MKQLWKETDGFAVFSFYYAHNLSIEDLFPSSPTLLADDFFYLLW